MIEITLFSLVALMLLFVLIQRTYRKKNAVVITVIVLMLIGTFVMPYTYINTDSIPLYARVISYALAIMLPTILITLEIIFKTSYDEMIILGISNILSIIGKKKSAKDLLSYYTSRYENCYKLHRKLGQIYESEGGIRRSINEYIKAVDINKKDYDLYFRIIQMMEFLDKKEETKELLVRLIGVYKKYPEAYIMFGEILEDEERFKDAVKVYTEGIKHNPNNFDLEYLLISTYLEINEFKAAQNKLEELAKVHKKEYIIFLNLGQLLLMSGEPDEARGYFEKTLKFNEVKDLALYELAKIHMVKGDEEKAVECLNKALEINFNLINRINKADIFSPIKEDVVTKMDAGSRPEDLIPERYIKTFEDLEEKLELVLGLSASERKDKTEYTVNSIIKNKGESLSVEELQERLIRTNEFIKKNIENVDEDLSEYFNFSKGRHDRETDRAYELKDFRLELEEEQDDVSEYIQKDKASKADKNKSIINDLYEKEQIEKEDKEELRLELEEKHNPKEKLVKRNMKDRPKKMGLKKESDSNILKRILNKDYDNNRYNENRISEKQGINKQSIYSSTLSSGETNNASNIDGVSIKERIVNIHKETEHNLEDLRKGLKKNLDKVKHTNVSDVDNNSTNEDIKYNNNQSGTLSSNSESIPKAGASNRYSSYLDYTKNRSAEISSQNLEEKDERVNEKSKIKEDKKYQLDKEKYIENLKTLRNMNKQNQERKNKN